MEQQIDHQLIELKKRYQAEYPKWVIDVIDNAEVHRIRNTRRLIAMDWHISKNKEVIDGNYTVFLSYIDLNEIGE